MKRGVKVYSEDGELCAEFFSIKRKGNKLIIDGKVLGVMRMDMIITFDEFMHAFRLLFCWASISFILLIPSFGIKWLVGRRKNISLKE
jgi:hypothetical protein